MPRMRRAAKGRNLTEIPCWLHEWAQDESLLAENDRDDAIGWRFFHLNYFTIRQDEVRDAVLEAVRRGELTAGPPDGPVLSVRELEALEALLDRMVPEEEIS